MACCPVRLLLACLCLFSLTYLNTVNATIDRGVHRTPIAAVTQQGETLPLYVQSHALLIGASGYTSWPRLSSVAGELDQVQSVLETQGFDVERIQDPDSLELKRGIEAFIDQHGYDEESRLIIYFSGHGHSLGSQGFLVPVDAPLPDSVREFRRRALSMIQIVTWAKTIQSKHVLFVFDSCFSGSVFKTRNLPAESERYIRNATARPVRQFLTAGGADETVPARSTFTPAFVNALQGDADLNDDGYVTGSELGVHLSQLVPRFEDQTPQYGKIRDYELSQGDFVFVLDSVAIETSDTATNDTDGQGDTLPAAAAQVAELGVSAFELAMWEAAQGGGTIGHYEIYLKRFPDGFFTEMAQLEVTRLLTEEAQRLNLEREQQRNEALKRAQEAQSREQAEQARVAEETRQAEAARVAEEKRRAEAERVAEETRQAEAARVAEAKRRAEAERVAEEKRQAEAARVAEAKRKAEVARLAEEQRKARAARAAEEKRNAELAQQQKSVASGTDTDAAAARWQRAEASLKLSRDDKRAIQRYLNSQGIFVGKEDGLWGARTRAGLSEWQRKQDYEATGFLTYGQEIVLSSLITDTQSAAQSRQAEPTQSHTRESYEPEMITLAAGSYTMGSKSGDPDEEPVHTVVIPSFALGRFEVTFDEYDVYARSTNKPLPDDEGWGRGRRPVINVSWNDAQGYVAWLSRRTGKAYRLPSESEWEYAARGGTWTKYSMSGSSSDLCRYANGYDSTVGCPDMHTNTAKVGSFRENQFGFQDMMGNVLEWVEDCWNDNYEGAPTDGSARLSGDCRQRVLRGGAWDFGPWDLRVSNRFRERLTRTNNYTGFRVARTLPR